MTQITLSGAAGKMGGRNGVLIQMKDDQKRVFESHEIAASIERITRARLC